MSHEALCWADRAHVITASGVFGGAPMGPRSAVLGGAGTFEHIHWGLRWCPPSPARACSRSCRQQ
eukprot:4941548-Pyramimonas_sp.AAC.1